MVRATLIADPQIRLGQQNFHVQSGRAIFPFQSPFNGPTMLGNSPENVLFQCVKEGTLTWHVARLPIETRQGRSES